MDPIKEFSLQSGLGAGLDRNGNTFWCLGYIGAAVSLRKRVIFVSSRYSSTTYRKLVVRWDPSLVTFVEAADVIGDSLSVPFPATICKLAEIIRSTEAEVVIFDDFSIFERLGAIPSEVAYTLLELYDKLSSAGLLFAQFSVETKAFKLLKSKADFTLEFENIGAGFGKDVTGKMSIFNGNELLQKKTDLLYYIGDRGAKYFYPGNVPLQM